MHVQAYLSFEGRCEEALEFYKTALGATVPRLLRFREMPEGSCAPGQEEKVMHCEIHVGDSVLLASDGMCRGGGKFEGIALTLSVGSDGDAHKYFDALAGEGGMVTMPLTKTFFSSNFGMVRDKFGVDWMIIVAH